MCILTEKVEGTSLRTYIHIEKGEGTNWEHTSSLRRKRDLTGNADPTEKEERPHLECTSLPRRGSELTGSIHPHDQRDRISKGMHIPTEKRGGTSLGMYVFIEKEEESYWEYILSLRRGRDITGNMQPHSEGERTPLRTHILTEKGNDLSMNVNLH